MVMDCVGINPFATPGVVVKGTYDCVNGNLWDMCLFEDVSDTSLQGPLANCT